MSRFTLHHGDCREVLRSLPDASVDSIVTDPPYGLSFMGKHWDYDVPGVDIWAECLRVLKPGGHLLAFAGTRTQHRMAVRIEDAGFEIRDMIAWVYGCLDEATEVATEKGVMPYHKTKVGDRVLCYDVAHGEYTYQPILEIVEYDYSDTAYRLVGDFGEQVVSRNHRVIVECCGSESFNLAETLGAEARVPVLESLPALQQAVHDAQQVASRTEQDVQQSVCKCTDRTSAQRGDPSGAPQGQNDKVLGLRGECVEASSMAAQGGDADVQQGVQRGATRCGVGCARAQGTGKLDSRIGSRLEGANDRGVEPGVEGWSDVSEQERCVCRSADQVRSMPSADVADGSVGRIRDGASVTGGVGDQSRADTGGVRSPHQPRCDGQPRGEPDAVCHERSTQGVRAWEGHRSAVVRVVPFHYTGKVWCLRVPTGAFVAVRNGVAFPTGNSGFPKSLDVSKEIDKAAGRIGQSVIDLKRRLIALADASGMTRAAIDDACGFRATNYLTLPAEGKRPDPWVNCLPPRDKWVIMKRVLRADDSLDEVFTHAERAVVGKKKAAPGVAFSSDGPTQLDITAPATEAARQWQGWGTAMKPALEPITVARKPLGTCATNVLKMVESQLRERGVRGEILWKPENASGAARSKKTASSGSTRPSERSATSAKTVDESVTQSTEQQSLKSSGQLGTSGLKQTQGASESFQGCTTSGCGNQSSVPMEGSAHAAESVSATSSPSTTSTAAEPGTASKFTGRCTPNCAETVSRPDTESFAGIATGLTGSMETVRISRDSEGFFLWPKGLPEFVPGSPLTVAANVLAHGTGGLNIDGCRIVPQGKGDYAYAPGSEYEGRERQSGFKLSAGRLSDIGRWPANLIHDGSDEVVACFPVTTSGGGNKNTSNRDNGKTIGHGLGRGNGMGIGGDTGSAARFFYCAKASKSDRSATNHHPTVKPTDLMRWLIRLVTPADGLVLDPFMGSGSTGKAAMLEGMRFVGIDLTADYIDIARARIDFAARMGHQPSLMEVT